MSRSAPTPITTEERESFMNGFRDIFQAIHNDHPNWGPGGRSLEYVFPFFEAIITRILENYSRHHWDESARARERDIGRLLEILQQYVVDRYGNRHNRGNPGQIRLSLPNFVDVLTFLDDRMERLIDSSVSHPAGRVAAGYTQAIIDNANNITREQRRNTIRQQQLASNEQMARILQRQYAERTERLDRRDAEKMQHQEQERRRQRLQEQEQRRLLQEQQQRATNEQIARNHELALRLQGEGGRARNPSPAPPRGRDRSHGRGVRTRSRSRAGRSRGARGRNRTRRNRNNSGSGGILSSVANVASMINPFPAIWAAFTGCKRTRDDTGACELPRNRNQLPPIEIVTGEDGFPFLNDLIPGTGFTFRELRGAIKPTKSGARDAGKRGAMAIHKVMQKMVDAPLAYRILNEFALNHPQWNQHRDYNARQILDLLRTTLIQFTQTSDRIYSNPHAIEAIIRKGAGAIVDGVNISIGGREVDSATFVLLMIFFIGQFPPAFQKRWAENYIRDNIEAYQGAKLETFPPGGRCSSCAKGIVERMFFNLFSELNFARERVIDHNAVRKHQEFNEEERKRAEEAAKRAEEAAERDRIAAEEEAERNRFRHADGRRAMVQEWTRQYYMDQGEKEEQMNAKGLREYLQSRINSNSEYENTQTEWDQSMHNYFTDEILNGLDVERGGKSWDNAIKGGKRRYKKKKTKKSKKRHRKKTRKAGKKNK